METGRYAEARDYADQARTLYTKVLSEQHWLAAWATSVGGASLARLGDFEPAEDMLVASYEILNGSEGVRPLYIELTLNYLVQLYDSWGKPEQAGQFRTRLREAEVQPN